jgi:hypothetical protein
LETPQTVYRYRKLMSESVRRAGKRLEAIISGDTHQFQLLGVHTGTADATGLAATSDSPLEIIAGHAGTKLDPALGPRTADKSFMRTCDQGSEHVAYFQRKLADSEPGLWIVGKAVCSYGYAAAYLEDGGWTFSLKPFGTSAKASCKLGTGNDHCYDVGDKDKGPCFPLGEDGRCLPLH